MAKSAEETIKEHLCTVFGFALDDVQELYELGLQTVRDTWNRLTDAFSLEDLQEMTDASHMLKGTLLNMGLTQLGETARRLEMACRGAHMDEIRTSFAELESGLECLLPPSF